jgi:hypothetical protein
MMFSKITILELGAKFQRVFMNMTYACECYYNFILWSSRQRNPDMDIGDTSIGSVGILRYMPRDEEEDLNAFTKMLFYCLLRLQVIST